MRGSLRRRKEGFHCLFSSILAQRQTRGFYLFIHYRFHWVPSVYARRCWNLGKLQRLLSESWGNGREHWEIIIHRVTTPRVNDFMRLRTATVICKFGMDNHQKHCSIKRELLILHCCLARKYSSFADTTSPVFNLSTCPKFTSLKKC